MDVARAHGRHAAPDAVFAGLPHGCGLTREDTAISRHGE